MFLLRGNVAAATHPFGCDSAIWFNNMDGNTNIYNKTKQWQGKQHLSLTPFTYIFWIYLFLFFSDPIWRV